MNNFYVYEWIRLDTNEPFYVGKGSKNRVCIKKRNKHFNNIVEKVDRLGYKCITNIVYINLTEKESFQKEVELIKEYRKLGYKLANMTDGGEGVTGARWTLSEETKKKQSENNWMKGKGYLISGINHPMFGKKHTINSRLKVSLGVRKALLEGKGCINQTDEVKKKIGIANSGSKNGMYGNGYKISGEKNPWFGKEGPRKGAILNEETLNKISQSKTNISYLDLYKNEEFYKRYLTIRELKKDLECIVGGKLGHGIKALIKGWEPTKKSQLYGWSLKVEML